MGCVRDTVRRALLITRRDLKNEHGTQEVGEESSGSSLSQPEPVGEINAGRQTNVAAVLRHRLFCLLFTLTGK